MQGAGLLTGLKVTIKHFFGKNETVQYPEEKLPMSEAYRGGHLVLNRDKCIGCSQCSMVCPNKCLKLTIEVDENKKRHMKTYMHNSGRCLFCNFCVEVCPTKAVTWNKNYEESYYHREELTYDAVKEWQEGANKSE